MMNHGHILQARLFRLERYFKTSIINVINDRLYFQFYFVIIICEKKNNKIYEYNHVFNEYPVHTYVRFSHLIFGTIYYNL